MSIDMSTPFDFLKTMRLSDYEHTNDFFADLHEQLDLYAIDKNNKIKALEEKLRESEEKVKRLTDRGIEDMKHEISELREKLRVATGALERIGSEDYDDDAGQDAREASEALTKIKAP